MDRILPKAMEDRVAIGQPLSARNSFLASEWRAACPPRPERAASTSTFGKARRLHLRAAPASHDQERERAHSIALAACEVIDEAISAIQQGGPPAIVDLAEVVDAVTASLLRDAIALPSVMRLRQHANTYMHSVSVCQLMIALAIEMGFDKPTIRDVGLAGLLHDIGKCSLPSTLFDDDQPYPNQVAQVRGHAEAGYLLLKEVRGLPDLVLDVCRSHHERPDGSGYPQGLSDNDISIYAKICAVCNFYDNMTCPPAEVAKWSPGQTIEYLRSQRGEFNAEIVAKFIRAIGTFLPGTLVRLGSDRIGLILEGNAESILHPDVVVFKSSDNRDLNWQKVSTKRDPILSIERPENWHLVDWPRLRERLLTFVQ